MHKNGVSGASMLSLLSNQNSLNSVQFGLNNNLNTTTHLRNHKDSSRNINHNINVISDDEDKPDDDDLELLDDLDFPLPSNTPLPKVNPKRPLDHSSMSSAPSSTQFEKPMNFSGSFSIIDPVKLGLTDLLDSASFKEPRQKKQRVELTSADYSAASSETIKKKSSGVISQLEGVSKLSQQSISQAFSRLIPSTSQVISASERSANTDISQLHKYIRLCEAKIQLLTKRNAVNDSTSLSLDAKTQWIKEKYEPRMKTISSDIQSIRPAFTFLDPPLDEKNLSNVNSDIETSQLPPVRKSLFDSSPLKPAVDDSLEHSRRVEIKNSISVDHIAESIEDSESLIQEYRPNDYTSNIEEARRMVQEEKERALHTKTYGAKDDDSEDDFGANYLDGLVSSQDESDNTDLSGFVVRDNENGNINSPNSVDNTYLGTQNTQDDSAIGTDDDQGDISEIEALVPIQHELQDLLSGDDEQNSNQTPDAIEIIDDDNGPIDFTSQLNENRDEIVHIPSEDELDDEDIDGLRELLHIKLEPSLNSLPKLISESDFSDDDDELLQLTKNVNPSPSDLNLMASDERRVIPGSEKFIDEIYTVLNKNFGLAKFRPNQLEAVVASLQGKDVFVLLPTGGGKSLCFQLPALVKGGITRGVTIVVSPLISLMQDQVQHLLEKNIRAGMISSRGTATERNTTFKALTSGQLDLVYLSPEMINNSGRVQKIISKLHENDMLARVVVDEAHCVSSWGHDFRPDYQGMNFFKQNYPRVPIMALTATASEKVILDIIHNLQMDNPVMLKSSFNRTNLFYTVRNKPPAIYEWISNYILSKHKGQTGIIYCHSKQSCETTSQKLNECGISCLYYHAGMDFEERLDVQLQWQNNKIQLICATIAFGMGIDKPDVRFVIHMYIPRTLEGYYQETGRAGRDGKESDCIMFYSYKDARALNGLIQRDKNLEERAREWHLIKLRQMVQYSENKTDCRRRQVLHFFNEAFDAKKCQKKCDNCCTNTKSIIKDVTQHCVNIMKMVQAIQNDKVTVLHCQDVYKGSKNKKIVTQGHHENEFHGMGRDLDRGDIERIIFELQSLNGLVEYQVMRGGFATSYIRLGSKANEILKGKQKITLSFTEVSKAPTAPSTGPRLKATGNGQGLDNYRYTDSFVSALEFKNQGELEKENYSWLSSSSKIVLPQETFNNAVNDSNSAIIESAFTELRNFRQQKLSEKGFARSSYYVSDALLKEMAIKLPTNARDFAKLENASKDQVTTVFADFKKTLGSLARARKGGSQDPRTTSQNSSPYFKLQKATQSNRSHGRAKNRNSQSGSRNSGSRRANESKGPSQSTSKHIRQMPI